jgi:hypothetical protein
MDDERSLFCYRPEQARQASRAVFLPAEFVDAARPLGHIPQLLESAVSVQGLFKGNLHEDCYYALMVSRERLPVFFPVHDICLLAANLLRLSLRKKQVLVLLDWEMLPVAVLAARFGIRVILPPCSGTTEELGIADALRRYLPEPGWEFAEAGLPLPEGCVVLGQHPLRHGERDPRFLEKLARISGGVFYSSWDFLGVKLHAHTRSLWLKTGLIRGVLQLPRPRRQGAAIYPALVKLDVSDPARPLRLARIPSCAPGPGALEQSLAVSLLAGHTPTATGEAIDLLPEVFARDGLFDLSPVSHLSRQKMGTVAGRDVGGLALRQCAQVLRCQLLRTRIDDEELHKLLAAAADSGEDGWGEYPDGSFVGREVSLSELDSLTGFLDERDGNAVLLQLPLLGTQGKYVLRAGDILFAFRGTAASIGQVGFVEEEGIPAITGQAVCIIRCLPGTDPVWLYYYLRRPSVREWVRGKATGSTVLTINLESIRDIPVELPGDAELDALTEEHRKITSAMSTVAGLRREIYDSLQKIHKAPFLPLPSESALPS